MTIINDVELKAWAADYGIEPFSADCINPASIDLRWSGQVKTIVGCDRETLQPIWHDLFFHVSEKGFYLLPGYLYLMDSLEYIRMPADMCGFLTLKSSMGRAGLEHLHAGFFDPSFHGSATWEMKVMSPVPILLKPGQRVMQLALDRMDSKPEKSYALTGRYNGQDRPQEAIDL